jgi:dihydrofolate reductase
VSVGLIWAQSENAVIGVGGSLPWRLPEDLAHFRALTTGATVVMGRRTWESLPSRFRPLPDRHNIVLTRTLGWTAEGATVAHSLVDALAAVDGDMWVLGGASVYAEALPLADRVEMTELRETFSGDVYAPELSRRWRLRSSDPEVGWYESAGGLHYRFRSYAARSTTTGA